MDLNFLLFLTLAMIAVAAALGMLFSRNAVYAALFLVLNFGTVAVLYLLLGAPFIAMAQITVYAGAIMVLFLFVIMLLGAEKIAHDSSQVWQRILAGTLAVALIAEAVVVLTRNHLVPAALPAADPAFGSPQAIGTALFGLNSPYLLPFEITSVLLLAAMVGAIVLTKKEKEAG
jgi:NADH-quinone oxidoreductase subunit J